MSSCRLFEEEEEDQVPDLILTSRSIVMLGCVVDKRPLQKLSKKLLNLSIRKFGLYDVLCDRCFP